MPLPVNTSVAETIAERGAERRRAPRASSSGRLEILLSDPIPTRVDAELIEISSTGFRAAHDSSALEPGLEVLCKSDVLSKSEGLRNPNGGEAVRARVIWTHVLGGRRVSGFLLVRE